MAATVGLAGSLLLSAPSSAAVDTRMSNADRSPAQSVPPAPPTRDRAADEGEQRQQVVRPGPDEERTRCLGLVPSPYPYAHTEFVCNDWRFGPAGLPRTGILGNILRGYDQFGALTPVEFLNKWWNPAGDFGQGDWKYSLVPDDGFAHDSGGNVIAAEITLKPGQLLDRFGNEFGKFLAPAGAKYGERSIPPSGLNTQDPRYPFNYHLYRVKKDTLVCTGPAAPAFEQPGLGVQYVTSVNTMQTRYCPHVKSGATVSSLVGSENLERVN
ncbi:TNT domain-containing protein [Streptomyces sp. NPDC002685]|uniref:TNT domain-containing protein n=1 Tax=Streptomyces sp. NPDC002685 TaxID=3154540 RepID=UPI00332DA1D8